MSHTIKCHNIIISRIYPQKQIRVSLAQRARVARGAAWLVGYVWMWKWDVERRACRAPRAAKAEVLKHQRLKSKLNFWKMDVAPCQCY